MSVMVAKPQLRGDKAPANLHEEAMRALAGTRRREYEAHEFVLPSATTNVSINTVINHATTCSCARAAGFGGVILRAARVSIRNSGDGPIVVRYNLSTADPITIEDGERHDWDVVEVEDIRFTNVGGAGVLVRVLAA